MHTDVTITYDFAALYHNYRENSNIVNTLLKRHPDLTKTLAIHSSEPLPVSGQFI